MIAVGAANFLWQLGSSNYFVDEILSVSAAFRPLGNVLQAVSTGELTPPAYFYFLHEWLTRLATQTEWIARLPSAACGALLVGAVYWLAWRLAGRRAVALGSAALTAASPFVLEYSQRAQGYVFVMLAVTLTVAAALQAERSSHRRTAWLMAAAGGAVVSLWLHYTAGWVLLVLCGWVARRPAFTVAARRVFVAACALAALSLAPLVAAQHASIPARRGVAASAGITATTVARLLDTPFDGRVDALRPLGIVLTLGALALVLTRGAKVIGEWRLLALIAAGEPLALLLSSAFGAHLMLTRYAAVAAPFMIVAIAAAIAVLAALPRPAAGGLVAVAIAALALVTLQGLFESHRAQGFYPDARGVVAYVRAHERAGDLVVAPSNPATAVQLLYYGVSGLRAGWTDDPAAGIRLLSERRHRLWTIVELPGDPPAGAVRSAAQRALRPFGYRVAAARVFPGVVALAVVLAVPSRSI